jgi:hypothetical protein
VVVSPPGSKGATLLLARASKPEQHNFIGNQAGGVSFFFQIPTTFGETINKWYLTASSLFGCLKNKITAQLQCLKTYSATFGIYFN